MLHCPVPSAAHQLVAINFNVEDSGRGHISTGQREQCADHFAGIRDKISPIGAQCFNINSWLINGYR